MSITVMEPGLLTTVQDLGRFGLQQYGIPVSGPMDRYSFRAGNLLLANPESAAGLEITLMGPRLKVNAPLAFAVTGAKCSLTVNGEQRPMWQAHVAEAGDVIAFGPLTKGSRVYFHVHGGLNTPVVMGSRSTFLRGKIGGVEGRPLKAGDELLLGKPSIKLDDLLLNFVPSILQGVLPEVEHPVRVVLGPQDDYFPEETITTLFSSVYTVTNESDRMGFRLEGQQLKHKDRADIVSDGIAPGAIQVPGHGQPIVMMADRQTTGGYPKIGAVITADLPLLGQVRPGDRIRFVRCTRADALKALREQEDCLATLPVRPENKRVFNLTIKGTHFSTEVWEVRGEDK